MYIVVNLDASEPRWLNIVFRSGPPGNFLAGQTAKSVRGVTFDNQSRVSCVYLRSVRAWLIGRSANPSSSRRRRTRHNGRLCRDGRRVPRCSPVGLTCGLVEPRTSCGKRKIENVATVPYLQTFLSITTRRLITSRNRAAKKEHT